MIEVGQILVGLVQRTEEGRLKWSRAAQSDRFVTSVDAISLVIMEINEFIDEGIVYSNYRLNILDESGEVVESLGRYDTSPEQDEQLARLYVLARRSALNIDSTLEKLAKALDL